jgi:hypothetical protein
LRSGSKEKIPYRGPILSTKSTGSSSPKHVFYYVPVFLLLGLGSDETLETVENMQEGEIIEANIGKLT